MEVWMKFCAVVAFLLLSVPSYAEMLYFPQVVDGGGYQTTIIITNPGQSIVTGTLRFYTPGGQPWRLSINSSSNSEFPIVLGISASARFVTSGTGNIAVGWASLESTGILSGVATYEVRSGGALMETVGVLGALPLKQFTVPADYDSHANVGIAIINTGSEPLTVHLSLLDESGSVIQTSTDPDYENIPVHGYVTKYANQAFPSIPSIHRGTLVGQAWGEGSMAVVSLILKDGMQSAIPATDPSIAALKQLTGVWTLGYDWGGMPWEDIFLLPGGIDQNSNDGAVYLWGMDEFGGIALATWEQLTGLYMLLRPQANYNDVYMFEFTGENNVSGCYFYQEPPDGPLGDCYDLTGERSVQ